MLRPNTSFTTTTTMQNLDDWCQHKHLRRTETARLKDEFNERNLLFEEEVGDSWMLRTKRAKPEIANCIQNIVEETVACRPRRDTGWCTEYKRNVEYEMWSLLEVRESQKSVTPPSRRRQMMLFERIQRRCWPAKSTDWLKGKMRRT